MTKGKDIAFIFEESSAKEFIQSIKTEKKLLIVCGNDNIKRKFLDLGYSCKSISEYSDDPSKDLAKAIKWIKNWPDTPILNGKSLKKLIVYDGLSIFWFLETRLYSYRIQGLIPLIEQIKRVVYLEKPEQIWIKGNSDVRHIVSQLYGKNLQKLEFIKEKNPQTGVSYKSYSGYPTLKLLLLKIFRGFPYILGKQPITDNPVLVLTEVNNWRKEYDFKSKKIFKKDVTFHDIIKKLSEKSIPVKVIDFENKPGNLLKSYFINKERNRNFGVRVEPWEKYITLDIIRKSKNFNKKLIKTLNQILNSKPFIESLTYDKISIYEILRKDIKDLFKSFKTFTSVTLIETAKQILEREKPSIIIMHDEYGAIQISLINEAKKRNIPTVSIQHGANTETGLSYVHNPEHVFGKNKNTNFPLPDKMCVWSESAKNNLLKFGNFPPSTPVVTGDPKVDFFPIAIKQFDYEKITKTLKIPKEKKIILFATQPLHLIEEKELITRNVMNSVKKLQNCYLIIKMHPNESDFSFYQKLANESKITDFLLVRFHNLFELIYIADIVIVPFSTVGMEAMRMKKPVIAMNLLGLHDNDPLIKSNIALVVKTENELIPTMKKCLDEQNISKIIERGKVFAQKEIGIPDGSSSERIVNLLLELMKKPEIDK